MQRVRAAAPALLSRVVAWTLVLHVLLGGAAHAQALTAPFTEVHTIATASTGVPVEHQIDITTPGTYQVTLTDLGAQLSPPAPLASLKAAVTSGTTLVGTPLSGAGVLTFNAASAGSYLLHVTGLPGAQPGSGPIGIQVGTAGNPSLLDTFSDTIALPGGALPNGEAVLNDSFVLTGPSANYTLTLTDFALPQALGTETLILIAQGSPTPVAILPDPVTHATQASVVLQQGTTYRIVAAALPGTSGAGLLSATVTTMAGAVVYGHALPVGATMRVAAPGLPAGPHTIQLKDLNYPAALAQLGGIVLLLGQPVVTLTAGTPQNFIALAGTYEVYVAAVPAAAAPAAGSYAVQLQPTSGTPEVSTAQIVTAPGSAAQGYSFSYSPGTAGSYTATLTNFAFPVALAGLRLAVVQNGTIQGAPLAAAGSINFNAAAAPVSLLVLAQADPVQGGVFDINVTAQGNPALLFDATQGVVGSTLTFVARKVTVTQPGSFLLKLSDVGFPANFANIAALVSQGGTTVGSVFGSDQLPIITAAGSYYVSLIAAPANTDKAGTYGLSMTTAPTPTLTFTANPTDIASGGVVTLTWSTTNVSSCTASDGWSGTQPTSGSVPSPAIVADTTFTLSCTGPGGTIKKSVTVTLFTPTNKGGGGAIDPVLLALLALTVAVARVRFRRLRPQ
ncbi:MAG: hypothetical protein JOZ67_12490 [Gammaproteobacteria bacterium]|nr:hypothetical protein [Gammaproteobacteria bacterium]